MILHSCKRAAVFSEDDICKANIKKRGRRRDLLNLSDTLAKNESIYDCYIQSDIDFDVVEIFETNERW